MNFTTLQAALERARHSEPPAAVLFLEDPNIHLLASLCRELQKEAGDRPFALSARSVQLVFGHVDPMDSWRWLRGLCLMRILKLEERGRNGRPNQYRYIAREQERPTPAPDLPPHIAMQVLHGEFDGCDDSTTRALVASLLGIEHPAAHRALEILGVRGE